MSQSFQKLWIKVTSIIIIAFGPIFFLGSIKTTSEPARLTLDFLYYPIDSSQSYEEPTIRFLSALTGGFLFGWGVMVWLLSKWLYDKAPNQVRKSLLFGLIAWFIVDSTGSFLSGAISNVIFNTIILLITAGPLCFTPLKNK